MSNLDKVPDLKASRLLPEHQEALGAFFEVLSAADYETWFSPHPLTRSEAARLVSYNGKDYYAVLTEANDIVAYGMLRGWDEGYVIPSLGIAAHPELRGRGIGRKMMNHLHEIARSKGATQLRLTVNKSNVVALNLYSSLGYKFENLDDDRLVGKVAV